MFKKKFRSQVFDFDQYWNIHYTEVSFNGQENDYKVFIKAKSLDFAKEILLKRIREDDEQASIKSVQGYMFHGNYKYDKGKKFKTKTMGAN